ncbi:MAG: NAD(P)-dependent glycerol-3-phosphate dehydrogenase [Bifidobacteriaceae bacterium]|jgi:glycerol-3-phosphate dehydrogenase (NAD(P)+)|nr:NAD(P)-dependent glycerol-3-phosphate dehydrogenase [Bifidobacteriaceae bacterium]
MKNPRFSKVPVTYKISSLIKGSFRSLKSSLGIKSDKNEVNISILGNGACGTSFAKVFAAAKDDHGNFIHNSITIWGRNEEITDGINKKHRQIKRFPEIQLPKSIKATTDKRDAIAHADIVFIAVSAQNARAALAEFKPFVNSKTIFVSLMKGLEADTNARMSTVISDALEIPLSRVAVLYGPNLAGELMEDMPSGAVVSSSNLRAAKLVARVTNTENFRVYLSPDVIGVELCGSIKNVIAISIGACRGLGYGYNTSSTLIARGLAEMVTLGKAMGAKDETFFGLAGVGDLIATCSSSSSRNHAFGYHLGQGLTVEEAIEASAGVCEGFKTAPVLLEIAEKNGLDLKLIKAINLLIRGEITADQIAVLALESTNRDIFGLSEFE